MTKDFAIFLATVYGEAASSSASAWRAVAEVIVNRVGNREWAKYKTTTDVIANTGFDAYTQKNTPYVRAYQYFTSVFNEPIARLDMFKNILAPIYLREVTPQEKIVLYYSPKAQEFLHNKNPKLYTRIKPKWAESPLVVEVKVPGCEKDDFAFYKYV